MNGKNWCRIDIYEENHSKAIRLVGRAEGGKILLNAYIMPDSKPLIQLPTAEPNTTNVFYFWRFNEKRTYGFVFPSTERAEAFAKYFATSSQHEQQHPHHAAAVGQQQTQQPIKPISTRKPPPPPTQQPNRKSIPPQPQQTPTQQASQTQTPTFTQNQTAVVTQTLPIIPPRPEKQEEKQSPPALPPRLVDNRPVPPRQFFFCLFPSTSKNKKQEIFPKKTKKIRAAPSQEKMSAYAEYIKADNSTSSRSSLPNFSLYSKPDWKPTPSDITPSPSIVQISNSIRSYCLFFRVIQNPPF